VKVRLPSINELEIAAEMVSVWVVRPPPVNTREALRTDASLDRQPDRNHFVRPVLEALQIKAYALHDDVSSSER
jgi:hypothetical protein